MDILFDILAWIGFMVAGFAVAAAMAVAAMAWLLNRPIDDDQSGPRRRGC